MTPDKVSIDIAECVLAVNTKKNNHNTMWYSSWSTKVLSLQSSSSSWKSSRKIPSFDFILNSEIFHCPDSVQPVIEDSSRIANDPFGQHKRKRAGFVFRTAALIESTSAKTKIIFGILFDMINQAILRKKKIYCGWAIWPLTIFDISEKKTT